jgi:hypothetical protein
MANYTDAPTISVEPEGNDFVFTIKYTASFTPDDLAFQDGFAESVALFESDKGSVGGGFSDDHIINQPIRTYRPSAAIQTRTFIFKVERSKLDTELGGEEIYAQVHFRRNANEPSKVRNSAILPLAV